MSNKKNDTVIVPLEAKIKARIEVLKVEQRKLLADNQNLVNEYNKLMRIVTGYNSAIAELQEIIKPDEKPKPEVPPVKETATPPDDPDGEQPDTTD